MERNPCVYIITNEQNGTLYIGVTSDLVKRIYQHKNEVSGGFSKQYKLRMLVWYEQHESMDSAIQREKILKKWNRQWKLELIEAMNPNWDDLYETII